MSGDVADLEEAPFYTTSARERRLANRFLYHWVALRRTQELPSINDLNIAALPAPWEQCFLLTSTVDGDADEFDHLGEKFAAEQAAANGNRISAIRPESVLDYATRPIPQVIAERIPMISNGNIVSTNRRHVKFRSIILPFTGPASGNLYLLGSASWREDAFDSTADMEDLTLYKFDHDEWRPVSPVGGMTAIPVR